MKGWIYAIALSFILMSATSVAQPNERGDGGPLPLFPVLGQIVHAIFHPFPGSHENDRNQLNQGQQSQTQQSSPDGTTKK